MPLEFTPPPLQGIRDEAHCNAIGIGVIGRAPEMREGEHRECRFLSFMQAPPIPDLDPDSDPDPDPDPDPPLDLDLPLDPDPDPDLEQPLDPDGS